MKSRTIIDCGVAVVGSAASQSQSASPAQPDAPLFPK